MSTTYGIYVGPYIRLTKTTTEYDIEKTCCLNADCVMMNKPAPNKFCSDCGKELQKFPHRVVEKYSENDINEDILDCKFNYSLGLTNDKIYIYYPDKFNSLEDYDLDHDYREYFWDAEITPEMIPSLMQDFKNVYQAEIAALENKFGTLNVSIEFGVLTGVN